MKLSVIGLGKLGVCTAVCFASKGYDVLGVDINQKNIDAVNAGKAPVFEPRLQELIEQSQGRLRATHCYATAIKETDITFLIVPTPSQLDDHFSDQYLRDSLKPLSEALKEKNSYHIFVITSTVSPGTINRSLIPLIEYYSGKKLNEDFGIAYNPEFIALGSVISDFLKPDMVLIGESESRVGSELEKIYLNTCENQPYIARMSLVSAEIAKISLNSYVTMKISFANTIANICESIEGANIDDVTRALGADKRISPYYLKGGLGFGGPCFPRDNRAFSAFAADYGVDAKLAKATDMINMVQNRRLADYIVNLCSKLDCKTVAVLGLSYKPNTPVIEESPGVKLIQELLNHHIKVIAYDSLALENAKQMFEDKIDYAQSIEDCFSNTSIGILMTADPLWAAHIDEDKFSHKTMLIDCWRMLKSVKFSDRIQVLQLGQDVKTIKHHTTETVVF